MTRWYLEVHGWGPDGAGALISGWHVAGLALTGEAATGLLRRAREGRPGRRWRLRAKRER